MVRQLIFKTKSSRRVWKYRDIFFFLNVRNVNKSVCYVSFTNEKTHEIINKNLHRAPMFTGDVEGVGPRYCPAIESKIIRFADKERHQLFWAWGTFTNEIYIRSKHFSSCRCAKWNVCNNSGVRKCANNEETPMQ